MKLFEPITIRGMTLKNRIIFPPMVVMPRAYDYRSRELGSYFLERARGGAGALMVGYTFPDIFVSDDAWGQPGGAARLVEESRPFTDAVRQAGARIGIQLAHHNLLTWRVPGTGDWANDWVAPSAMAEDGPPLRPGRIPARRELTIPEIETIIGKFATAALRVKEAGFDFVEFHNAHGHLPCQFFSPADNQRTDKYGGNLERRMRFGLECIRSMRAEVGDDYPIFVRLAGEEERPGGITLADSSAFAVEMEKAGADVIDVSGGLTTHPRGYMHYLSPTRKYPLGTFVPLAAAIKQKVNLPVVAVGRINRPDLAESILANGQADLIAIGRQLIADPFWPNKVAEGRVDEIIECDSCNHCWRGLLGVSHFYCRLNQRAGQEWVDLPL